MSTSKFMLYTMKSWGSSVK